MAEYCTLCGSQIEDWALGEFYQHDHYCLVCYERKHDQETHRYCARCGSWMRTDTLRKAGVEEYYCGPCFIAHERERIEKECAFCHKEIKKWEKKFPLRDGRNACQKCHDQAAGGGGVKCARCGLTARWPFFAPDGNVYCTECVPFINRERVAMTSIGGVLNRLFTPNEGEKGGGAEKRIREAYSTTKIDWD